MPGTTWSKFYWADWRSDPALRLCSAAARGLWIEILCLCAESDEPGMLLVKGRAPSLPQLASLVAMSETEVVELLAELENNGVYSRTRAGVIYSRRMRNDAEKSRKNSKNGKLGGNPTLRKQTENQQSLNPEVKPTRARVPSANSQIPEESLLTDRGVPESDRGVREEPNHQDSTEPSRRTNTTTSLLKENYPGRNRDSNPTAAKPKYAYEGRVIRLNQRDYDQWERSFRYIHLDGQLASLDAWLDRQAPPDKRKNWFHVVAGALAKKNQEAMPPPEEALSDLARGIIH